MKLYNFFFLLSVYAGYVYTNQDPGLIILINGTSCAGKSTLTHALAERLKEQYYSVHECFAQECCAMTIPHHAGRTWYVVHTDDIWEYICDKEYDGDCWHQAIATTAQYACSLAHKGYSVIVDTSITRQEDFELFDDNRLYTILAYAPLSVLCMRDQERAECRKRPYKRNVWCRHYILDCFKQMYRPAQDGDVIIDYLEYADLLCASVIFIENEICIVTDNNLQDLLYDMLDFFSLNFLHTSVAITFSIRHDLTVLTDEPLPDSLQHIMVHLPA